MSEELRKILENKLRELLRIYDSNYITEADMRDFVDKVFSWHIQERKKWAKDCVPKEKKDDGRPLSYLAVGYNQCRAEILKAIEESE